MIHESHVLLAVGRPADAAACARDGIVRARELGLHEHELVLIGNLGEALAASGALPDARRELEAAVAGWAELDARRQHPRRARHGLAAAGGGTDRGRARRATARCRPARSPGCSSRSPRSPPATRWRRWPAAARTRRPVAVSRALDAWGRTDDRLTAIPLLAVGAEALGAEDGHALRRRARGHGRGGHPAGGAVVGLRPRRPRPGRPRRRSRPARRRRWLRGARAEWWAARSRFAAGLADGRSDAAADDLLAARRAFRAMGADGWRRRAEARLRAIGRRIPTRSRPPTTPGAGLSARELEVLAELALGLRNRDIGERLFISERTVARHLVQINAKLGVTNRTAAVRVAQEMGLLSPRELGTTP